MVNNVLEADPRTFKMAVRSRLREKWLKAITEELEALEENGVWKVVRLPRGAHALHAKWGFKQSGTLKEPLNGSCQVSLPAETSRFLV